MLDTCMVTYIMSSMFLCVHTSKMYYVCHHILALKSQYKKLVLKLAQWPLLCTMHLYSFVA